MSCNVCNAIDTVEYNALHVMHENLYTTEYNVMHVMHDCNACNAIYFVSRSAQKQESLSYNNNNNNICICICNVMHYMYALHFFGGIA